jgi:hypothetical protein
MACMLSKIDRHVVDMDVRNTPMINKKVDQLSYIEVYMISNLWVISFGTAIVNRIVALITQPALPPPPPPPPPQSFNVFQYLKNSIIFSKIQKLVLSCRTEISTEAIRAMLDLRSWVSKCLVWNWALWNCSRPLSQSKINSRWYWVDAMQRMNFSLCC